MSEFSPEAKKLLEGLNPGDRAQMLKMLTATDEIIQKKPELASFYSDYLRTWKTKALEHDRYITGIQRAVETGHGVRPERTDLKEKSHAFSQKAMDSWNTHANQKYGAETATSAMKALGDKLNESIFSKGFKNFYDEDRGGLQAGGLLGGALGGMMGIYLSGGLDAVTSGNLWSIGAGIVGIILGSVFGNIIGNSISSKPTPVIGNGISHDKARGQSQAIEQSSGIDNANVQRAMAAAAEERKNAASLTTGAGSQNVPNTQSGTLPAQSGPTSTTSQVTGR